MPDPAPSRFAHQTLHQQFLAHMEGARQVTNLGVFQGVNAPRPSRPAERFNSRLERGAQLVIAGLIGALVVYGYGAEAAVTLLARV